MYGDRPDDAKLAFVRICSHYFAHDGFLEDGVLIREAGKLAGIPGVLIHGRNDLGGGACTPWELARAWPGAELIIIEDSGHTGSTTMTERDARRRRPPLRADHEPRLAAWRARKVRPVRPVIRMCECVGEVMSGSVDTFSLGRTKQSRDGPPVMTSRSRAI